MSGLGLPVEMNILMPLFLASARAFTVEKQCFYHIASFCGCEYTQKPRAMQVYLQLPGHNSIHHRLYRPLSPHSPFPPPGKVPGISAKTVHFPPWLAGALAPQTSLAAPAVSTSRESAGFFRENGSLSPAAGRGTGSTAVSRRTRHFHPQGKCRAFLRKRFTFPRGLHGYRLHRPLSPHSPFPPLGKVPGISAKTVHFPPVA